MKLLGEKEIQTVVSSTQDNNVVRLKQKANWTV